MKTICFVIITTFSSRFIKVRGFVQNNDMRITVKLFATLREGRFDKKSIECDEGTTIAKILKGLDISKRKASIIFVNNRHADLNHELSDEDVVALFPPVGGG